MIGKSRPDPKRSQEAALIVSRSGSPKDIFETPNTVLHQKFFYRSEGFQRFHRLFLLSRNGESQAIDNDIFLRDAVLFGFTDYFRRFLPVLRLFAEYRFHPMSSRLLPHRIFGQSEAAFPDSDLPVHRMTNAFPL